MNVNPNNIQPSQNFLKEDTVKYILDCIRHGDLDKLPPTPIVRKDKDRNLVAIDGHNLIAVKQYLDQDVNVHIASSPHDGLPPTSEANVSRNKDLENQYDDSLKNSARVADEGIKSFSDLAAKYPNLFE